MLTLEGLTVRYGNTNAVRAVDLELADGETVALLGPSGCGKSTLLRAVAGLESVHAGRISWDGMDLAPIPVHRRGFGLMFQDGVLFPHRDVAGNIAYGLRRIGASRAQIISGVGELLDLVGLAGYGSRPVRTLSGGEQQRVALARALAPSPRLLLLDEPLAALDRSLRERLIGDLREVLRETRTTALFVTHDQSEAFAIATTVALMESGRIRQVGAPQQVWAQPADPWVAGFVGYSTVLDVDTDGGLGVRVHPGERLALRPSALHWDPRGPIVGVCEGVAPAPEASRLTVSVEHLGVVQAIAPAGKIPAVGSTVHLRFDPAGSATIPPATLARFQAGTEDCATLDARSQADADRPVDVSG